MWEQAVALREAGLPVVLEYPEDAKPEQVPSKRKQRYGVSLSQAVPDYIAHLQRCVDLETLSAKTAAPWSTIIRRADKAMPGVRISALDSTSLDAYFDGLILQARAKGADGRSSSVNARACFVHFFDWAVSKQLVSGNPAKDTKQRKYKASHAKIPDEDVSRYLSALREMRQSREPERLAVIHYLWLMTLTGYRKDELATATVGDFYLAERKRHINVSKAKDGNDHYIGLSHMAVRVVREQIRLLEAKNLPVARSALLFPAASALKKIQHWHGDGLKPMSDHVIYKFHQHVIDKAGIEGFTIHDFRRIFATMAAQLNISSDTQRLLISHTTGRRETHADVYVQLNYLRELKEAASKLAVVFDFLSCEIQANGKRMPLECQDDFTESFAYWKSDAGRTFANEAPKYFYVAGLVQKCIEDLHQRDLDSGFDAGVNLAKKNIRKAAKQPRNKVKNLGHALAAAQMIAATGDAANQPFALLQDDDESAL